MGLIQHAVFPLVIDTHDVFADNQTGFKGAVIIVRGLGGKPSNEHDTFRAQVGTRHNKIEDIHRDIRVLPQFHWEHELNRTCSHVRDLQPTHIQNASGVIRQQSPIGDLRPAVVFGHAFIVGHVVAVGQVVVVVVVVVVHSAELCEVCVHQEIAESCQ